LGERRTRETTAAGTADPIVVPLACTTHILRSKLPPLTSRFSLLSLLSLLTGTDIVVSRESDLVRVN
jgi:hypothetical protein